MESNNEDFFDYQEPQIDEYFNRLVHEIFTTYEQSSFINNTYSFDFQEEDQQSQDYNILQLLNSFFPMDINDPIESVLQDSFEINQQKCGLEKTDHIIKISSQRYSYLTDTIKFENKCCTICIVDFENDDMISITNCNHIYHTDCIKEWGKYKTECPICREPLE